MKEWEEAYRAWSEEVGSIPLEDDSIFRVGSISIFRAGWDAAMKSAMKSISGGALKASGRTSQPLSGKIGSQGPKSP